MSSDRPSLPYVVRYPWYVKLMVPPLIGFLVLAFFPNPRPIAFELWEQTNLIFRLCMLLTAVMIPAGIAEISFFKTIFTDSGIEQRSKYLTKMFKPYSEIEAVEYRPESVWQPASLIITFSDLRTMRLYNGLFNVQTVDKILDTYTKKLTSRT